MPQHPVAARAVAFVREGDSTDQIVTFPFSDPETETVVYTAPSIGWEALDWARQHDWIAFEGTIDGASGICVLAGLLTTVSDGGHFASWKRCITDLETGLCTIPAP